MYEISASERQARAAVAAARAESRRAAERDLPVLIDEMIRASYAFFATEPGSGAAVIAYERLSMASNELDRARRAAD